MAECKKLEKSQNPKMKGPERRKSAAKNRPGAPSGSGNAGGNDKTWLQNHLGQALALPTDAISKFLFESKNDQGSLVTTLFLPYGPNSARREKTTTGTMMVERKGLEEKSCQSAREYGNTRLLPSASMVFGSSSYIKAKQTGRRNEQSLIALRDKGDDEEKQNGRRLLTNNGTDATSPRVRMDQLIHLDSDSDSDSSDDEVRDDEESDRASVASTASSSSSLGVRMNHVYHQDNFSSGKKEYLDACLELGVHPISLLVDSFECEHVSLAHQHLGEKGAMALARALEQNQYISSINLTNCLIGFKGATALADMLATNSRLVSLELSDNALGNIGGSAFAKIFDQNRTIQSLVLSNNKLGDKFVTKFSQTLVYSGNNSLVYLDLSKNQIGEKGAIELSEFCAYNYTLLHLDIGWNNIKGKGAVSILQNIAVSGMSSIEHLNMSWNGIDDTAAEAIGATLASAPALKLFDLRHNRLSHVTAKAIVPVLETNQNLLSLQLGFNPLGWDGCVDLVNCLEVNRYLRVLGIENAIGLNADDKMNEFHQIIIDLSQRKSDFISIIFEHPPKPRAAIMLKTIAN